MRALWRDEEAAFSGAYVSLPPAYAWPKPVGGKVPVLIGGAAGPLLFAAIAEYADGWMPIGGAGIAGAIGDLRRAVEGAGRDPDAIEVVPFGTVPDEGKLAHYAEVGCTEVVLRIPSGPPGAMLEARVAYARYVRV